MNKDDLIKLKKNVFELTEGEKKQRDLYLKALAEGTVQGPLVGVPSIDKPWLKYYGKEFLLDKIDNLSIYLNLKNKNKDNLNANK